MADALVRHAPEHQRYEILLDGELVGHTDYRPDDQARWVFHHTEVDPGHQGEGLAGTLVRGALDDVRAQGRRIAVTCPYVRRFLEEHPEYADLLG